MKKVFVFTLICLAFLLFVPGIVSADGALTTDQTESSGTTTVTYGISSKFQLSIPPSFTLGLNDAKYERVAISNARLPLYTYVSVSVSSNNYNETAVAPFPAWRMKLDGSTGDDPDDYISYHLHTATVDTTTTPATYTEGERVKNAFEFLNAPADSFSLGAGMVEKYLKFYIDGTTMGDHSGTYKDTLVFNAVLMKSDGSEYSS